MAADGVWGKLHLKGQQEIVVLNAPDSFKGELAALDDAKLRTKMVAQGVVRAGVRHDAFAAALDKLADGDVIV